MTLGCSEEKPPRPDGDGGGSIGGGGSGGGEEPTAAIRCIDRIDFGTVLAGEQARRDLVCANDGSLPVRVDVGTIAGDHPDRFVVEGSSMEIPPGSSAGVAIVLASGSATGRRSAEVPLSHAGRTFATTTLRAEVVEAPVALEERCEDGGLDFGYVPLGASVERTLHVRNLLTEEIQLASASLPTGYRLATTLPLVLPPAKPGEAQSAALTVVLEPTRARSYEGEIEIEVAAGERHRVKTCVAGYGGGPILSCEPTSLDFGETSPDLPIERRLTCRNAGTDDPAEESADNLFVSLALTSDEFTARVEDKGGGAGPAPQGYRAGASFDVVVAFEPEADGDRAATLVVLGAGNAGEVAVALSGQGRILPPCEIEALPSSLDWGHVPAGRVATLDLGLRNRTEGPCLIRNLRVVAGETHFSAAAEPLELGTGGIARIPVAFHAPRNAGETTQFEGKLRFEVSDPDPEREIDLRATSGDACIVVLPEVARFSQATQECASSRQTIEVINACETAVVIEDLRILEGPGCPEPGSNCVYGLADAPALPSAPIPPGRRVAFDVVHGGAASGHAALQVEVQGHATPYFVQLVAEGPWSTLWTDVFDAPHPPKVDVLWVVDNSAGMDAQQIAAGDALPHFLGDALHLGVDFQMAITTTDVHAMGEKGRIVPLDPGPNDPRIFTPWTPNLHAAWRSLIHLGGGGSAVERGLEAARLALSPGLIDLDDVPGTPPPADGNRGFLRSDAALHIVIVADEDDEGTESVVDHVHFFRSLKPSPELVRLHGWVASESGCDISGDGRYLEAIRLTGGVARSVCAPHPPDELEAIGVSVFANEFLYRLSHRPVCDGRCEDSIEVAVDGAPRQPAPESQHGWRYDSARNAIVFPPIAAPDSGDQVEIEYPIACDTDA